jgi:hypothetical protein
VRVAKFLDPLDDGELPNPNRGPDHDAQISFA